MSRVSLMKNGEEVVSVGGAMEPSAKNMGISASNSVLLNLARVCCVPVPLRTKNVTFLLARTTRSGSSF